MQGDFVTPGLPGDCGLPGQRSPFLEVLRGQEVQLATCPTSAHLLGLCDFPESSSDINSWILDLLNRFCAQ
jgi:hypothetical protein